MDPLALSRIAGNAAVNGFRFTGRLNKKKLKPGRYLLVATPNANGQPGRAVAKAFQIVT